jgi:hypothetical protein
MSILSSFPTSDAGMIPLDDPRTLNDYLCEGFDNPLLHRASVYGNSLSGRKMSELG